MERFSYDSSTPFRLPGFLASRLASILLPLVFILFISYPIFSQKFDIKNYSIQDGLAQSQVYFITQDPDGYMWFATSDGISRFDGISFKNYSYHNGMAENDITTGWMDKTGKLWLGHRHGGISIYDARVDSFKTMDLWNGKPGTQIYGILEDQQGNFWIATNGKGIYVISGDSISRFTAIDSLNEKSIFSICQSPDGAIWFATDTGIYIYQSATGEYQHLDRTNGLTDLQIYILKCDQYNRIWAGTFDGDVFVYDPVHQPPSTNIKFKRFSFTPRNTSNVILSILVDNHNQIWISRDKEGVYRITTGKTVDEIVSVEQISQKNGLSSETIFDIFQDREGNLWFGTNGGGVCKFRGDMFHIYTTDEGLTDNSIWDIYEDSKGNYWFAGEKGVTRVTFHRDEASPAQIEHFDSSKGFKPVVVTITEDQEGKLYFGSFGNGITILNPATGKISYLNTDNGLPGRYILDMETDAAGNIWIATYKKGAIRFNPRTKALKQYTTKDGLGSDDISYIYIDGKGTIWFATEYGGLCSFDGINFNCLTKEEGLTAPSVLNIVEDVNNHLWVGTPGFGLFYYDDSTFHHLTTKDGLSGDYTFLLASDDSGNVWTGTSRGLDKINPVNLSITHFGKSEGFSAIETNENAVLKDRHGNLWFGTIGGAIRYNPKANLFNPIPPKVQITHMRLFLRDAPFPKNGVFTHNQNHLTFQFIGISLTNPEKVRYQYRLKGFDASWSPETYDRTATYSNLPPGEYSFQVKACNANGVWVDVPTSYHFVIQPPYWRTWWFRFLVLMLMVFSISGIIDQRVRHVKRKKRELELKVKERTRDLMEEKEKVEQAYRALQESEQKFRDFTESSSSAIFIHQNGTFCYVNPATQLLLEYDVEELIRIPVADVVHPDSRERFEEVKRRRLNGDNSYIRYELKIITRSGKERWIDLATCIIEYDGKPAILGTAFDITERKLAEDALAEEEARLRTLIDAMPDFVCFKDCEGRWLEANQYAVELFGLEDVDYHGKKDRELAEYKPLYREALLTCEKSDELAWKAGCVTRNEEAVPQEDGDDRIFDVIKVPIFKEDGSRKALVIIGRDVTERIRSDEELRAEKERLAVTLRSIGDGVISTDRNGKILLINEAAEKLTGYSHDEAVGKPLAEVFRLKDGETGTPLSSPHQMVIETGKVIHQEKVVVLTSRDGEEHLIVENGAPIRDGDGKTIGTVLVFRDVTEQHRLEEELFKAQKLESIGVLAGGIAHDFNNILTAILGNISLSKISTSPEDKLFKWLSEAENATMRAKDLTYQLLTFSKGGAPILKSISVGDLITQTVKFVLRGSNVRSEFRIADNLWGVKADEGQISQVLNNLVFNAQQAMPEGGTITVTAENIKVDEHVSKTLTPGRYVKITIADEGIGIPESLLGKIFDPYFTTKQAGSGLGLATTYSIIKKHQGAIEVESKINVGTRFHIYLPASAEEIKVKESKPDSITRGEGKILVMDDDAMVREAMGHLLGYLGYQVEYANDGHEALEKYQQSLKEQHPYHLVIMDLTIPGGMGGKEAIGKLLSIDPEANAIVSSGYSNDPVMAKYREYGFKGIIKKPYRLQEINSLLSKILGNGKA